MRESFGVLLCLELMIRGEVGMFALWLACCEALIGVRQSLVGTTSKTDHCQISRRVNQWKAKKNERWSLTGLKIWRKPFLCGLWKHHGKEPTSKSP